MTQEEKDLLLKDLCARLPYGVNCEGFYSEEPDYKTPYKHIETCKGHVDGIDHIGFDDEEIYIIIEGIPCELLNVRPYLRPMSSMTKKEKNSNDDLLEKIYKMPPVGHIHVAMITDWLLERHFDIHDLISKGLALEAPEGMYNLKEK